MAIIVGWSSLVARQAQVWAAQPVTAEATPVKFGEPFTGNPEPNAPELVDVEV